MRKIPNAERKQRGCGWCDDCIPPWKYKNKTRRCPYEECPYHELDGFKTYGEYLKSIGADSMDRLLRTLGMKRLGME